MATLLQSQLPNCDRTVPSDHDPKETPPFLRSDIQSRSREEQLTQTYLQIIWEDGYEHIHFISKKADGEDRSDERLRRQRVPDLALAHLISSELLVRKLKLLRGLQV